MVMEKSSDLKGIKRLLAILCTLFVVLLVGMIAIQISVNSFNKKERTYSLAEPTNDIEVTIDKQAYWSKVMPESFIYPTEFSSSSFQQIDKDGKNISYGRTCEFKIVNKRKLKIRDWKMEIVIHEDLYVNKSWNGEIEFYQFGGKKVDKFNTMLTDVNDVGIDYAQVDELLLFPLKNGDKMIYHPNIEYSEFPLSPSSDESRIDETTIGIIFYTSNADFDLGDVKITFYFGKSISNEPFFYIFATFMLIDILISIVAILDLLIGEKYARIQALADQRAKDELGKALKKAEDANRAKTIFLNNMSHDIRTPMNAIVGFSDLLEKELVDQEKAKEYVTKIKSSSNFLLSLINNVLEVARIESGKTELHEEVKDMKELNEEVVSIFQEQMKSKEITFTHSLDITHKYVLLDSTKLREILLNILSNALKYTLNGGTVDYSMKEIPSQEGNIATYRIVVLDTGIGMAKEFLANIFDEFSRERTTTESGVIGSGLGMSIVKQLVDLMNGNIEIESEKGKGTKVTINLSFKISDKEDQILKEIECDEANVKGKRILLVEDNELNLEIATAILEEAGFIIESVTNGQECITKLQEVDDNYFDVILMDIQMPVMNGYEATKIIRKMENKNKANIPIIAMTANAFEEDKKTSLECGMNGHITKPLDPAKMIKIVSSLIK